MKIALPLLATLLISTATAAYAADPLANAAKDMKAVLDAQASLNPKPIETLTPAEARKQPSPADGVKLVMKKEGKDPADPMGIVTKDISIGSIPARIYTPKDADASKPLPVVVYYHGGGWVIADLDTYDATPRSIAKQLGAIVVSSHYRQAPEHKFPSAHEDAFTAYKWVLANAASFGGDSKHVAVMGESAGANLAINTSIAARDAKVQLPAYQVLIYPVAGVDMNTPSYIENADAKPLNKAMMAWFVKQILPNEKAKADPRLDIIGKAELSGLPDTTIITAGIDPLRSDGEMLAEKLKKSGVKVHSENYKGATHEFFGMAAVVDDAEDAQEEAVKDLKKALK